MQSSLNIYIYIRMKYIYCTCFSLEDPWACISCSSRSGITHLRDLDPRVSVRLDAFFLMVVQGVRCMGEKCGGNGLGMSFVRNLLNFHYTHLEIQMIQRHVRLWRARIEQTRAHTLSGLRGGRLYENACVRVRMRGRLLIRIVLYNQ